MQDSWHVIAAKPADRIYVVVIGGESARRDALGALQALEEHAIYEPCQWRVIKVILCCLLNPANP